MTAAKPQTPIDYNSLMQANLARVFGERDSSRRIKAIAELYADDATLYEPDAEAKGHAAINSAWNHCCRTCRRTLPSPRLALL